MQHLIFFDYLIRPTQKEPRAVSEKKRRKLQSDAQGADGGIPSARS